MEIKQEINGYAYTKKGQYQKRSQTNANQTQTKLNKNFKQSRKTKLIYQMLKQTLLKIMGLIVLWGKKFTNKMYSGDKQSTTHSTDFYTVTNGS